MKKLVLLLFITVLTGGNAWSQYINNGKVIDKNGSPIFGATVRGKGLMSSTTSNMDGSFSFETTLPIKQIEATYMGKTKIENRTDYTIIKFGKRGNSSSSTSSSEHPWFVAAQGGYYQIVDEFDDVYEGAVGGIMLGYSKNWGGYLSVMTDGDALLLTGGVIKRVYKTFNVYVGGGADLTWEKTSVLDLGILFKFNNFAVNLGMASEFDKVTCFRFGVGYVF